MEKSAGQVSDGSQSEVRQEPTRHEKTASKRSAAFASRGRYRLLQSSPQENSGFATAAIRESCAESQRRFLLQAAILSEQYVLQRVSLDGVWGRYLSGSEKRHDDSLQVK